MKYARIENGRVAEIVELGDRSPFQCFHEDVAAQFYSADDEVETGWLYADGKYEKPVNPLTPSVDQLKSNFN